MTANQITSKKSNRIYWLDNLRTIIILLVVLYHVGGVYEAAGLWAGFWIVDDPATVSWVGFVGIVFDSFIMPTMFFISGYLTLPSMKHKTDGQFLGGKFKRLMIPWVLAVLTLIPLYKVIFLYSRGLPQQHWTTYSHITNPNSQNWLWFLPLLFVFNLVFLVLTKFKINWKKVSLAWMLVIGLIVSFGYSHLIGNVLGFRSWVLTPLIDFESERLLLYFLSFLLGVVSCSQDVFADTSKRKVLYIVANSVAWLPITGHIFARIWPFFSPDPAAFTVTTGYRLLWYLSFYLSALCMAYIMIESFWRYLDKPVKLMGELNKNSYGVYIIHVVIIGISGTLMMNTNLPGVIRYISTFLMTYVASNLLVSAYRAVRKSFKGSPAKAVSPSTAE